MSAVNPQPNEVFTVRVYKNYSGQEWANTYELQAIGEVTKATLESAASTILAAEREFTFNFVNFDRVVVSTYVPDGTPYNPDNFFTVIYDLQGLRISEAEPMPLYACMFARRVVAGGRPGKAFYRGCLNESDVSFSTKNHLISPGQQSFYSSKLNTMLSSLPAGVQFVLASGRPAPVLVRPVISFSVSARTATRQLDRTRRRRDEE